MDRVSAQQLPLSVFDDLDAERWSGRDLRLVRLRKLASGALRAGRGLCLAASASHSAS